MKNARTTVALTLLACMGAMAALAQERRPGSGLLNRSAALNRLRRPQGAQQAPATAQDDAAGSTPGAGKTVEPGGRSIEFSGAPVEMVLKVYGDLVDKTVIKDPAAPAAAITLQPKQGQELTDEDKILAIETVLEMNGIHLESFGEKFVRALPRATARKEGIPLILDPDAPLGESSRVVSLMMTFRNIALDEAQTALEGLKSDKGVLNVYERSGSILVTDTEMNIGRMREIIKEIDLPTPVTENVFIRQIQNASATEIQKVLQAIVDDAKKLLEKQGKNAQNAVPRPTAAQPGGVRSLLRPQAQKEQSAPTVNESLVTAVSDADRGMIRGDSLIIADERSNKLVIKTQKANMDFFDKVIEQLDVETTPDTVVKIYRLKYAEAEDVQDMINDLIGNAPSGKNTKQGSQNANSKNTGAQKGNLTTGTSAQKKPANQRTGEAKAGELSKENTTVLADKRINGIVVMTQKELVPVIEQIIETMDIKLSQVLIETVIIEVSLGNGIESGIDWVQKGRRTSSKNALGQDLYYKTRTVTRKNGSEVLGTTTEVVNEIVPAGYSSTSSTSDKDGVTTEISETASSVLANVGAVARDGLLNYYTGGAYGLGGGANGGKEAFGVVSNAATAASALLSKSFSFVFDSDELGLSAILHMTESDSRAKYIASPIIMTLDNKEAKVNATSMHYLLKGFTSSGNSYSTIAVPDYEQKELGIEITTTPKINPNGTVMLTVEEKYTQLGASETIQYSSSNGQSGAGTLSDVQVPTTITREMSSDILLENGQTVVFGGLTETSVSDTETGIPFLKDIPWIGKWLFSSVSQSESRTELLVFMTPYVLDDAQAAQIEALRRKNTMSDSRPWEDHGWSKSALADPVSGKEKLCKQKDEWKKQDEDHDTERALDKARMERVIQLKARDIEERKSREREDKKMSDRLAELENAEKELGPQNQELESGKPTVEPQAQPAGDK